MSDIFISYSRTDIDFAQKIVTALAENNLDTWIDWKSIPKGEDWEQAIHRGIEEADAFLFLISPDSVASEPCNNEIRHAQKYGKRILPIFITNAEGREIYAVTDKFLNKEQKEEIGRRNFILCRPGRDDFNKAIHEIQETIQKDFEWMKYHTKLLNKALDWERQKDVSPLLRGRELREAERRILQAGSRQDPQPTDIQYRYINESRRREDAVRRGITIGLALVALVMIILAISSQRNAMEARIQSENVRNLYLADSANNLLDERNPDLAMALALYANRKDINQETSWIEKISQLAGLQFPARSPEAPYQALTDAAYLSLSTNAFDICGQGWAFSVDASRDGRFAAVACNDLGMDVQEIGSIILLDLKSGEILNRTDPGGWIYSVEFSPDATSILSGDAENQAVLWDLNGDRIRVFEGATDSVHSASFDARGDLMVTASFDRSVIVWDVDTGTELYRLRDSSAPILSAVFQPESTRVIFGDGDGFVSAWDYATGTVYRGNNSHAGAVLSLAFDPRGSRLASGGVDGKIILWQIDEDGYPLTGPKLDGQPGWIYSLAFLPDGTELISGSSDRSLVLWDLNSGGIRLRMDGHMDEVQSVAVDGTGQIAVSASRDGTVRVWDLKSTREYASAGNAGVGEMLQILSFGESDALLTASSSGRLQFWTEGLTTSPSGLILSEYPLTGMAMYPDGRRLLVSTQAGELVKVDLQTRSMLQTITSHSGNIRDVAISPDGRLYAAAFVNGDIGVWDSETDQLLCTLVGHTNIVNSITFVPGGKTILISGSNDHLAMEWNLETCRDGSILSPGRPFTGHDFWIMDVAASPDGRYIATASGDQTLIVWDLGTGRQIHRMRLERPGANTSGELYMLGITFSPDGKTILTGSAAGDVLLWSAASGKLLRHFVVNPDIDCTLGERCRWAWDVAFSGDGNRAYASFADGSWHAWNLIPAHTIPSLAGWITENRYVRPITDEEKGLYGIDQ